MNKLYQSPEIEIEKFAICCAEVTPSGELNGGVNGGDTEIGLGSPTAVSEDF
jgi:hypothetical protein